MVTKSRKRSGKATKSRSKSDDMTSTYIIVGLLVGLMLVLLYSMNTKPTPTTTTTQPGIIDSIVNALTGNDGQEGFTSAPSGLYDPEKEVLIAFCKMNGCGHCVRFQDNVWSKVEPKLNGKKNKDGKTIKMITVDPKHELSSDVSGFPTIKKYGDNSGKYIEFEEKRTVENFTNFCMN
jgi:hypothetical protein